MVKRIINRLLSATLAIGVVFGSFSMPAYARFISDVKMPTKQWTNSYTIIDDGMARNMAQLFTGSDTDVVSIIDVVRTDGNFLSRFTGGMDPDGDFHVEVMGAAGDTYKVQITLADRTGSIPSQMVEATVVAQSANASIQKIGTKYIFTDFTVPSISENLNDASMLYDNFCFPDDWFNPVVVDINKGKMTLCRISGSKQVKAKETAAPAPAAIPTTDAKYTTPLTAFNRNDPIDPANPNAGSKGVPVGVTAISYAKTYSSEVTLYNNMERIEGFSGGMSENGDFEIVLPAGVSPDLGFDFSYVHIDSPSTTRCSVMMGLRFDNGAKIKKTGNEIVMTNVRLMSATGFSGSTKVSETVYEYPGQKVSKVIFDNGNVTVVP